MERSRLEQEKLSEKFARILQAKNKVVRGIWSGIPADEKAVFASLEARIEKGQNGEEIALEEFWKNYEGFIRKSAAALNAHMRQTLVESAFTELHDRFMNWDGTPVVLFRQPEPNEQPKILEVYRFEPEIRDNALAFHDEQARQDIIAAVIEKDQLYNTPLVHPRPLAPGLIVTTSSVGMHKIVTPTMIDGVTLRFTHPQATSAPIVELVPEIAA